MITVSGTTIEFSSSAGSDAVARSSAAIATPSAEASYAFEVRRAGLILRVGSTIGGQDIVNEAIYEPGWHVVSFVPGHATIHIDFVLRGTGKASLHGFGPVAGGALSLAGPYQASDIPSLRFAQSLNRLWITHSKGTMEPMVLERRGNTSWSLVYFRPDDGPFGPRNDSDLTLTPSAREGQVTITASRPIFKTFDVGGLIRIEHTGQVELETFSAVDAVTDAVRVSGLTASRNLTINVSGAYAGTVVLERSIGGTQAFREVQAVTGAMVYNDGYDNLVAYYRLRMSARTSGSASVELSYPEGFTEGSARIVSVTADNAVIADVIEPFAKTDAATLWSFGAWSSRFGWPATVGIEDGRLWMGRRNQYWASASDDFYSFGLGTLANEALSRTLGGVMNSMQWLSGADGRLMAGMTGGEANIGSNAFDEVVTPSNVRSRVRTMRGSADANPARVDDHVAFISRTRQRIYRFGFNPDRSDYSAFHLTRRHRQIGRQSPFRQITYQQEPEPRFWIARDNGEAASMVYDLEEGVFAIWRYRIEGARIRSICATPGAGEDHVWMLVERTIAGVARYSIEKLAAQDWDDIRMVNRMHSAISYSGTPATIITGLGHLEGLDVHVWDGRQQGPFTVTGGQITLQKPVTEALIGRLYEGHWKSPRLRVGTLAAWEQVKRLAFFVHRTAGASFGWGRAYDRMSRFKERAPGDLLDGPVSLFTEDDEFPFEGETARDPRLHILMSGAGPCTILALGPSEKSNER